MSAQVQEARKEVEKTKEQLDRDLADSEGTLRNELRNLANHQAQIAQALKQFEAEQAKAQQITHQ